MPAAALGLLLALAAPGTPDPSRPRLHLHFEVSPGVGVSAADIRAVASGVRRIWAPIVDLTISVPGERREPMAIDTVRVVFANRTLEGGTKPALAWVDFVDGEPRPEITVSVRAVTRLRQEGTWHGRPFSTLPPRAATLFLQRALTRAIAHEVGHYLLRSAAHSSRGLMQAVFSVDELMDAKPASERIDRRSAERLRQRNQFARAAAND